MHAVAVVARLKSPPSIAIPSLAAPSIWRKIEAGVRSRVAVRSACFEFMKRRTDSAPEFPSTLNALKAASSTWSKTTGRPKLGRTDLETDIVEWSGPGRYAHRVRRPGWLPRRSIPRIIPERRGWRLLPAVPPPPKVRWTLSKVMFSMTAPKTAFKTMAECFSPDAVTARIGVVGQRRRIGRDCPVDIAEGNIADGWAGGGSAGPRRWCCSRRPAAPSGTRTDRRSGR